MLIPLIYPSLMFTHDVFSPLQEVSAVPKTVQEPAVPPTLIVVSTFPNQSIKHPLSHDNQSWKSSLSKYSQSLKPSPYLSKTSPQNPLCPTITSP